MVSCLKSLKYFKECLTWSLNSVVVASSNTSCQLFQYDLFSLNTHRRSSNSDVFKYWKSCTLFKFQPGTLWILHTSSLNICPVGFKYEVFKYLSIQLFKYLLHLNTHSLIKVHMVTAPAPAPAPTPGDTRGHRSLLGIRPRNSLSLFISSVSTAVMISFSYLPLMALLLLSRDLPRGR